MLQEVYVLVWRKAERFDSAQGERDHLARDPCPQQGDRPPAPAYAAGGEGIEAAADVEDDSPSAFDVVDQAQDAARLGRCLDELDERARAMIRAAFLDGASYPELAERENVPLGTMKSWIRRGLQRLRGCLER